VAVLTALHTTARSALWGVRARTQGDFDAAQPLARRFIHCWPATWGRYKVPQPAAEAEASSLGQTLLDEAIAENRRLLYVGLTRARDLNVLVGCGKPPKEGESIVPDRRWLAETGGEADLLWGGDGSFQLDDGQQVQRETASWTMAECENPPLAQAHPGCHWFAPRSPIQGTPLWRQPSAAEATQGGETSPATEAPHQPVGTRIVVTGQPDMATLGTALHLCVARATVLGNSSAEETARILATWGMANAVDARAVCCQVQAFQDWLASRWPGCPVLVETPIEAQAADGTRLRGRIDLLVDTPAGWVLVDHKAHPGGANRDQALVTTHAPQLAAYAQALHTATGRAVVEQWLYLPVGGRVVRVGG
jgi:ATP-dependent exoDNAse (exonuclease V) beta subunit